MKLCRHCESFLKECIEYYFNSKAIPKHPKLCQEWNNTGFMMCFYDTLNNQPKRSKRENSQKCEMRCSEHCGNTMREVQ